MSRIGKQPVQIPSGVTVKSDGSWIEVKGSKGTLKQNTYGRVALKTEGDKALVELSNDQETKYWGLYRTLLSNMVKGVSQGYKKELELVGTGYRAQVQGKKLQLTVGFSHPVLIDPPEGISFEVDKTGKVVVNGVSKELVGQMAAKIRDVRPPEPYHGKGIRYAGEVIVTKVGKSAAGSKKK